LVLVIHIADLANRGRQSIENANFAVKASLTRPRSLPACENNTHSGYHNWKDALSKEGDSRWSRCFRRSSQVFDRLPRHVGQVGNVDHENQTYGKAGPHALKGIRPTVRGVAMNPVDHPHGVVKGRLRQSPANAVGFPDARQEDARQQAHRSHDRAAPEVNEIFRPPLPADCGMRKAEKERNPRFRSGNEWVTKWTGAILNESAQGKQDGKRSSWLALAGSLGERKNASNTYTYNTRSRTQGAACEASSKRLAAKAAVKPALAGKPAVKVVVPLERCCTSCARPAGR